MAADSTVTAAPATSAPATAAPLTPAAVAQLAPPDRQELRARLFLRAALPAEVQPEVIARMATREGMQFTTP